MVPATILSQRYPEVKISNRSSTASPDFSNTPFIMITAESKTENVIAAKKAGVNNYIVKPFNAATLKTKMEAVFPG